MPPRNVDTAFELFVELGFQATTMDKEALFGAAIAAHCPQFAPLAMIEDMDGPAEDLLMAVALSLLHTLLDRDVRSVEAMITADPVNQQSLGALHFESGPAHVIAEVEALLRHLHEKGALTVPDPHQSARLFGALIKGSDLLMIARFDEARAKDATEIKTWCRSAVDMFVAAHGGNHRRG